MIKKRYTIGQLSELTGFSRRTIRYYVAEGLLDPPAGRGRGGFYFDSHLEVLRRIRFLREKGVRLSAIFEMLRKDAALQVSPEREVWIKYEIEPGVELLIERGLEEQRSKDVAEVVRVARSILSKGGKDNE